MAPRPEELALDTVDLVDELLRRLGYEGESGRLEIEIVQGRGIKLWAHKPYNRSELVRFDQPA